jgi:hypothetical protein
MMAIMQKAVEEKTAMIEEKDKLIMAIKKDMDAVKNQLIDAEEKIEIMNLKS